MLLDQNNAPPGAGLGAIVLGFVVVAIGMSNVRPFFPSLARPGSSADGRLITMFRDGSVVTRSTLLEISDLDWLFGLLDTGRKFGLTTIAGGSLV